MGLAHAEAELGRQQRAWQAVPRTPQQRRIVQALAAKGYGVTACRFQRPSVEYVPSEPETDVSYGASEYHEWFGGWIVGIYPAHRPDNDWDERLLERPGHNHTAYEVLDVIERLPHAKDGIWPPLDWN